MPTYSYVCDICEETVDIYKTMKEEKENPGCPRCGNETRRLFGASIHFIGAGWPSKQLKVNKQTDEQLSTWEKGFESEQEMEEGRHMYNDMMREKRKSGELPCARPMDETPEKKGKKKLAEIAKDTRGRRGGKW